MKKSVYDIMTEKILKHLEAGCVPWRQPYKTTGGFPRNLISKKPYRGINVFLLACQGYSNPYWLTYRQAQELGGTVKKGEKGNIVTFWREIEIKEEDEIRKIPLLRYYTVFNLLQCEGIKNPDPVSDITTPFNPIQECEKVISNMPNPPRIAHSKHSRPSYSPLLDEVRMPDKCLFHTPEDYYVTLFHEFSHATGHKSRLARKEVAEKQSFRSLEYTKEELVAEMGSAFLCGHTGIENSTLENSASYINGWLRAIRQDSKLVIQAASSAQRAADYILGGPGKAE